MAKKSDKKYLDQWATFRENMSRSTPIDLKETEIAKRKRIQELEANYEKWFEYYFPNFYTHKPMPFHIKASKRVIENSEWFEVRSWSREMAKSARTMMEVLFLSLTKKKKTWLMISNTLENATRLLAPYKNTLEANNRIINDYGVQEQIGKWEEHEFTSKLGFSFRALGEGQSPRGTRNDANRPDGILVDDFDTDEDCRNPDMIDKYWEWTEQAALGTRDSNPTLVIHNGNIIGEYCSIKKSIEVCDYYEIVNIRDKNGKSTWLDKNSEEMIDRILSKISHASAQKEYFNNPIVLGKVFKALNYGKIQPLNKYKYLVSYTDPSYKKNGDYKATALVGKYKDEYHIIDIFCQKTSTADMLEHLYQTQKTMANAGVSVYFYIEYPWIDDTLKREIKLANARHGITLPLKADARKKPEKFYRIESNLEPLNRNGKLIFNEKLKDKKDMKETEFQFLALSPKSRAHDDAPDSVEGAVWIANHKTLQGNHAPKIYAPPSNRKRY